MPCAVALTVPTDLHLVAASKGSLRWPESGDEYDAVGSFRGEGVPVVESETIPNLMVPAHAEYILEGEFLCEDEVMPPYAEDIASGHMFGEEACPIFKVKCITHRKNPWWGCTTWSASGLNGHEGVHSGLFIQTEADAIIFLRSLGFKVKDVAMLWDMEVAVIQLEVDGYTKPYPHYGQAVALACYGNPGRLVGQSTKYLIVVGPDVDPADFTDVAWALGTRTMPASDSVVIKNGMAQWGDPGGLPGPLGWKTYGEQILIDATIKYPERYDKWPPRCEPAEWEKAAIERMALKIGSK